MSLIYNSDNLTISGLFSWTFLHGIINILVNGKLRVHEFTFDIQERPWCWPYDFYLDWWSHVYCLLRSLWYFQVDDEWNFLYEFVQQFYRNQTEITWTWFDNVMNFSHSNPPIN